MTVSNDVAELHEELRAFRGSLCRYRHWFNRKLLYTPGVRHLAERAEAFWLLDEIALALRSESVREAMQEDERLRWMQFWNLAVDGSVGSLTMRADAGEPPWIDKSIPFTDFPFENIDLWVASDGECWTLYLPSEH